MIEITPTILFIQICVFIVGMGLSWKLLIKPFTLRLEERKKAIASNYQTADQIRAEADRIHKEYEARLKDLETKSQDILGKASRDGENTRQEIVRVAHDQARDLLRKTQEDLENEKQNLLSELHNEVGKLGILMAEKVLKKTFAKEDQDKLLTEITGELSK